MDIRSRIDSGYKLGIKRHNELVSKNRNILEKILNCVKCCGNYELPLRGHDEKISSKNRGVFRGLINLFSDLDPSLQEHFQKSTVFKGIPVERFWGFLNPKGYDADSLTRIILNEIDPIIEKNPQKFIAQAYDGAAVMSGHQSGVNVRIKEKYPYAYFIHCYAHQLNLIMAQATSQNKQRVAILDEIVGARLPKTVQTRWSFNIRTVNKVYEHRDTLIECMKKIIDASSQSSSINQATGLKLLLKDTSFIFWLNCFHKIMPHVDCLYNAVQARNTDPVQVQDSVRKFKIEIQKIRDNLTTLIEISNIESSSKRKRIEDSMNNKKLAALEVCDVISIQAQRRFDFTKHLTAAQLFQNEKYVIYNNNFPSKALNITVKCYPFFIQERLKTELEVVYSRDDFRNLKGVISTINYIRSNNMEDTFKEVFKLLKVLVVTPMTSSEAERSFSTLRRIKTCLRSTMCEDRLNALTMLSVESRIINEDIDFNKKVIDNFCDIKERSLDFQYTILT
ncbi:uncharacterized protein LOC112685954 [Sipha flava]|uniref:Uncharacterized protein LOC112685954 n=1 Tax=Sipha flava TaxID=143950 RepID=A0A8B8FSR1_9HEMI|nr:uncharacterized protein LOC112685954 [Sipha flava]